MKLLDRDTHDSGDGPPSSGHKRMLRTWRAGACAVVVVAFGLASCGTGEHVREWNGEDASVGMAGYGIAESTSAKARIGELRARFLLGPAEAPRASAPHGEPRGAGAKTGVRVPVLGAAVATGFERSEGGGLRAVLPAAAKRGVARAANVELPVHADGESHVEDATSRVSVRFRLHDAKPSGARVASGYVLYEGALDGADVVHRVHAEGTEDYVVFETRPAREELRYDVDVSRVPGLRLVSNTLEFLDEGGSPALRVAPPYVIDARGTRHDARLAVRGCMYDASVATPWGRPITRPGADRCALHVTWSGVAYPAMVDPAWTSTGSMVSARAGHTATVLASGKVLVAGGESAGSVSLASTELFDPDANGGVGSFAAARSMTVARRGHTASVLASGKVLVVGGRGTEASLASAELFDPDGNGGAGAFTSAGSMMAARDSHTANVLRSGKVFVAGGWSNKARLASAELFDPDANGGAGAFTPTGPMTTARNYHTATLLASGKVLVTGGTADAELFDPNANGGAGAFTPSGPMTTARNYHTASVLASGKVLLAGGDDSASAEVFDPNANGGAGAFAAAGSMATARYEHTASVLASGKVLVAGGRRGGATAELFDPDENGGVGAFAPAGAIAEPRWQHTASVLASGKVLVAGGYVEGPNSIGTLASTELFGGDQGDACANDGGCRSGFCVDLRCCDSACSGSCDRCDLPGTEGRCTAVPNDATKDCAPYKCDRAGHHGSCHTQCTSVADCIAPTVCDTNHQCVAAVVEARTDSGCSMATTTGDSLELAWVCGGLIVLGACSWHRRSHARRGNAQ